MSNKYYHGDPNRDNHFWVYPKNKTLTNKLWDTHNLKEFCNNYKYLHTFLNCNVDEYKCLGHIDTEEDILIAILAKDKEVCLPFYLNCIYTQKYDKKKIHLYIKTNDNNDKTNNILLDFIGKYGNEYGSVYFDNKDISPKLKKMAHRDWNSHRFDILGKIRQDSIDYARKNNWHYFVADCDNFITPNTLKDMYNYRKYKVIGPMLPTHTGYSNFHYKVDTNGYYQHHEKYMDLLHKRIIGIESVAVIHCTYFINKNTLKDICYDDGSKRHEYVIFSDTLRKKNIKQYLANDKFYGILTWHLEKKNLIEDLKSGWNWCIHFFENVDKYIT